MRRSTRWAALVGIVALGGGWLLGPGPAAAHSGARAQLYLADLRLEPAHPAGWTVEAVLTDRDSGQPLPGFDVQIAGVSPSGSRFGPVTLLDPEFRGHYSAPVTPEPGQWSITVDAKGFPGGAEGIPLRQTAEVHLTPGAGTRTAAAHRSGSSGGANPITWAVPSALAVLSGVWALAVTRRRSVGVAG